MRKRADKPEVPPKTDVTMVGHEPCVTVPLSHLRGNGNCATCKLFHTDRPAFVEIGNLLMSGATYADVSKRARELGHPISEAMLARHRVRHMDEALWELFEQTQATHVIAQECLDIPTGDLAQAEVKVVAGAILRALRQVDPKKLIKFAKENPLDFIAFASAHAKTLASVQRSDHLARLSEAKLQLERIKLDQNGAALLARAAQALRAELSSSPDGLKLIGAIEQFINAPKP